MLQRFVTPALVAGVMTLSQAILAQAPVEDRSVSASGRTSPAVSQQQPVLTQDASVQLFLELQTLRQEATELRGLIEELGYQLEQLATRQTNDYANLDRRILEINRSGGAPAVNPPAAGGSQVPAASSNAGVPAAAQASTQVAELYNQAFASLRSGNRDQAISQFEALVETYPQDPVAGDALYWMGETHWVAAAYEKARQAFVMLVERFPQHRRYGDALVRLGYIYHEIGDLATARTYLQKASALGGDVGARADEFLAQNFSQ